MQSRNLTGASISQTSAPPTQTWSLSNHGISGMVTADRIVVVRRTLGNEYESILKAVKLSTK